MLGNVSVGRLPRRGVSGTSGDRDHDEVALSESRPDVKNGE